MKKSLIFLFCFLPAWKLLAQSFSEVSREVGIDSYYEPRFYMGGGAAFVDVNNDDFLDIYVTGGLAIDKLYINQGDGTFVEMGEEYGFGITKDFFTSAVAVGDIENDGDADIIVTTWVGSSDGINKRNLFFENDGAGSFTENGESKGFLEKSWSMGATFGDINRDGFLDIYIINYVNNHGSIEVDQQGNVTFYQPDCFANYLYINNGDGTFSEVSAELGVDDPGGCSLAASFTDYNNDRRPDLLIANDFGWWAETNKLYANDGDMFTDKSRDSKMDIAMFGMGIATGDYDEDQDLDYYVTNIRGNVLMNNQGDGTFTNNALAAGVDNTFTDDEYTTGWGAVFFDYDNDSYLDLGVTNGYVATEPIIYTAFQDADKMYRNKGDGTFEDVSDLTGFNSREISRGLITGDYDNDGDLDAFVVVSKSFESIDPHFLLFKNETENANDWIKIQLKGKDSPRDAYGSRVKLYLQDRTLIREIDGGSSYASHNSSIAHFGLGTQGTVDKVEILWTSGRRQEVSDLTVNSLNIIEEDTSIDIITSVENEGSTGNTLMYPNPVTSGNKLYLKTQDDPFIGQGPITIRGVHAREVILVKPFIEQAGLLSVELPNLSNGSYIISFNTTSGTHQEVLLIAR